MPNMDRKKVLWKVRTHALQILSMRHPEEFAQIKAELLAKWGHQPIEPAVVRQSKYTAEVASHGETVQS